MGKVFVKIRIMPSDVNIDLNGVKERVLKLNFPDIELRDLAIKPIAFGLKSLNVLAVMPDAEGVVDKFVEALQRIDGVESVEIEEMELL
ncbi:MAG: elongation factor 1-beta [Archaeoglobaceae archaeon]